MSQEVSIKRFGSVGYTPNESPNSPLIRSPLILKFRPTGHSSVGSPTGPILDGSVGTPRPSAKMSIHSEPNGPPKGSVFSSCVSPFEFFFLKTYWHTRNFRTAGDPRYYSNSHIWKEIDFFETIISGIYVRFRWLWGPNRNSTGQKQSPTASSHTSLRNEEFLESTYMISSRLIFGSLGELRTKKNLWIFSWNYIIPKMFGTQNPPWPKTDPDPLIFGGPQIPVRGSKL